VYLNFAVIAGAVPPTATKKTHGPMRTQFKSTVLGKQFGMGVAKLHRKLIADTGRKDFPLEEAEALDRIHKETFADYWAWSRETIDRYADGEPLCTRDGWYLFCDNPNMMSVGNFPIQGAGGAILRRAVRYGQQQGLRIVSPLHDACYMLHREDEMHHVALLKECMNKAFQDFYGRDIRMDAKTWRHTDEFLEEGAEHTFALLAKYFMSEDEYANWPLCTNIIS
jgi:DNA polymerase-1